MTDSQDSGPLSSKSGSWLSAIRKINFRPYLTGTFPFYIFAHFGHHAVSAMLRPLAPMIRTDLNLSYTQIGWMQTAFGLSNGLSQLPAGRLADHFGARLMVLLGVTGVAVAGFFIGFTNSFAMLVGLLVLSALLGAGYHPASAAAITSSVPEEYRGRMLGVHLIGGTSAFWIVPLLAAPIAATWGWRSPYLILTAPVAILGVFLYTQIGKRIRADASRRQEQIPDTETPTAEAGINWGKLVPFITISVLTGTMVQSVSGYLALYATDVLLVSEATAAMLMSVTPAVGLFAAPLGGYLADRFGSMRIILIVSYITIPLIYLVGITPNVAALVTVMIVLGLVSNTRMPTSESYIAGNTPEHRRATVLGIYYFAGTGVGAPLAPIVGNLIDRMGFQKTYAAASAVTAAITLLCSLFLWKNRGKNKYPEITGE
jgi:MFS family permease